MNNAHNILYIIERFFYSSAYHGVCGVIAVASTDSVPTIEKQVYLSVLNVVFFPQVIYILSYPMDSINSLDNINHFFGRVMNETLYYIYSIYW